MNDKRLQVQSTTDFFELPAQCQRIDCEAPVQHVVVEVLWEKRLTTVRALCPPHADELLAILGDAQKAQADA